MSTNPAPSLPYPAPTSEQEWAEDYLSYLDAPASGPSDPRVGFLEAWETDEATFLRGNVDNPLDIEQGTGANAPAGEAWAAALPTSGQWNSAGVATYPSVTTGLDVTRQTMGQAFDAPILEGLETPGSTSQDLVNDLAESNWSGAGPSSAEEVSYANAVASDLGAPQGVQVTSAWSRLGDLAKAGADAATGDFPGALSDLVGATGSSLEKTIGVYILQGVLTLLGAGLVFYGATLTTRRGSRAASAPSAPAASPDEPAAEAEPLPFEDAAVLA